MLQRFTSWLFESANDKHVVFAFGRMNPPTAGHQKVVDKVHQLAKKHRADHQIVLSHSHDGDKNPLPAAVKRDHAQKAFHSTNIQVASKEHPSFIHHAKKLHAQGYTHLHMVAGSDRVPEYKKILDKYNGPGKDFHFKKITVHSAGERDPDAEGTTGISGSKMREHARNGDFDSFKKGAATTMKSAHVHDLYHDLRKHLSKKD